MSSINLAKKLINDNTSCVTKVNQKVTIALPPLYIFNESKGVSLFLQGWKNHYVKSLGGILLGYDNVNFIEQDGEIMSDLPYVYYQVSADFYVFKPALGEILFGKVNKVSKSHAGCLVYGCINVSLTLDNSIVEATIDNFVCIGQEMAFKLSYIDAGEINMRIRGRITHECLQILKDRPIPVTKPRKINTINGYTVSESEGEEFDFFIGASEEETAQSKQPVILSSKKRKHSERAGHITMSEISEPSTSNKNNLNNISPKKLKKKKNLSPKLSTTSDSGVESIAANNKNTSLVNDEDFIPPIKKKRMKNKTDSQIQFESQTGSDIDSLKSLESTSSSTQKANKKKKLQKELSNSDYSETDSVPRKKKHKKKDTKIENECLSQTVSKSGTTTQTSLKLKKSSKNTKKKRRKSIKSDEELLKTLPESEIEPLRSLIEEIEISATESLTKVKKKKRKKDKVNEETVSLKRHKHMETSKCLSDSDNRELKTKKIKNKNSGGTSNSNIHNKSTIVIKKKKS